MNWQQKLLGLVLVIFLVLFWGKPERPPDAYDSFLLVLVVLGSWTYVRRRQQIHAKLTLSRGKERLFHRLENATASFLIPAGILRVFTDYQDLAAVIRWVGTACLFAAVYIYQGAIQKPSASDAPGERAP